MILVAFSRRKRKRTNGCNQTEIMKSGNAKKKGDGGFAKSQSAIPKKKKGLPVCGNSVNTEGSGPAGMEEGWGAAESEGIGDD